MDTNPVSKMSCLFFVTVLYNVRSQLRVVTGSTAGIIISVLRRSIIVNVTSFSVSFVAHTRPLPKVFLFPKVEGRVNGMRNILIQGCR